MRGGLRTHGSKVKKEPQPPSENALWALSYWGLPPGRHLLGFALWRIANQNIRLGRFPLRICLMGDFLLGSALWAIAYSDLSFRRFPTRISLMGDLPLGYAF